ncbi:DUF1272 domain-containing protein [uncultured Maribacter sp.]|uniref:DUF1272 domain-containing protein n=1 Tax=uncultured Maribacter sp. TaxID=431308 RepID=UPI0026239611|nr:DUF1272 domain-containing protein [uncultured Maribacter sp.]
MLQIRPTCENCNKKLPPDSTEAMICSYECTFCTDCVEHILYNVCPNCGGGFAHRPVRPKEELLKNKASNKVVYKPIKMNDFKLLLDKQKSIEPQKR